MEDTKEIFENFKEQVRHEADIVRIISEYVPLKKKGGRYWGCCPFHGEKTPSFTVDEGKGLFHCFGCGAGGDVFSFIMKQENLSFVDALKFLANKFNISFSLAVRVSVNLFNDSILEKLATTLRAMLLLIGLPPSNNSSNAPIIFAGPSVLRI